MSDQGELQIRAAEFRMPGLKHWGLKHWGLEPARFVAAGTLTIALLLSACSASEQAPEQEKSADAPANDPAVKDEPVTDDPELAQVPEQVRVEAPAEPAAIFAVRAAPINREFTGRRVRAAVMRPPPPPPPPPPSYAQSWAYAGPPGSIVGCYGQLGSVTFAPGSADLYGQNHIGSYQTAAYLAEQVAHCGPGRASIIGTTHSAMAPDGGLQSDAAGQLTMKRAETLVMFLETRTDPQMTQLAQILVTMVSEDPAAELSVHDELQISFTPSCPVAREFAYSGTFGPDKDLPPVDPEAISQLAATEGLIVIAGYSAEPEVLPDYETAAPNPPILERLYDVSNYLASADALQGRLMIKRDYGPDCEELDQPGRIVIFTEPMPERYLPPPVMDAEQPRVDFTASPVVQPIPE